MTAISSIVNNIFNQYDRNGDQSISLRKGQAYEGSHIAHEVRPGFDYDEVLTLRYSHDKLFQAADKDGNGLVSRSELANAIKFFDTNNDDQLKNSGPFWNRKGELRNFDKAYPEQTKVLDSYLRPNPNKPPYNGHPGQPYYPGQPYPGQPFPHQPNHPHFPRALGGATVGVRVA